MPNRGKAAYVQVEIPGGNGFSLRIFSEIRFFRVKPIAFRY
jgi:hypothetical protein